MTITFRSTWFSHSWRQFGHRTTKCVFAVVLWARERCVDALCYPRPSWTPWNEVNVSNDHLISQLRIWRRKMFKMDLFFPVPVWHEAPLRLHYSLHISDPIHLKAIIAHAIQQITFCTMSISIKPVIIQVVITRVLLPELIPLYMKISVSTSNLTPRVHCSIYVRPLYGIILTGHVKNRASR